MTEHFGEIVRVRHSSKPHDPPDIELVFSNSVVACEHTRLQPAPLGWAEGLNEKTNPGGGMTMPSISNPPVDRSAMIDTILGVSNAPWSNLIDDLKVIRNSLTVSIQEKMGAIPNGGIIAVVNHVGLSATEERTLSGIITDLLSSEAFSGFEPYTLILLGTIEPPAVLVDLIPSRRDCYRAQVLSRR